MDVYANIRELLGGFIGRTIVDITQHDEEEWRQSRKSYVMLMFDDGKWIKFYVGDAGFSHGEGPPDDSDETEE